MTIYSGPIETQLFVGHGFFSPAKMTRKLVSRSMKSHAQLWTSTYLPDEEYKSDWLRFICEDYSAKFSADGTVIDFAPAQLFVIDNQSDLNKFMTKAIKSPHVSTKSSLGWPNDYDVDWTATAQAWNINGLRVTEKGHWATRDSRPVSSYTWDCESTAWIDLPEIINIEHIEIENKLDNDCG